MYGYSSAFALFISAGGLSVFVERVKDEIELCISAHANRDPQVLPNPIDAPTGAFNSLARPTERTLTSAASTGLLSFEQASLLKGLLRAIQRLMQTAGTTEGLRNLIDSSLLASVKLIMQNRVVFGPQVFALSESRLVVTVESTLSNLSTLW